MMTHTHRSCPGYQESKFRLLYVGSDLKLLAALKKLLRKPEYHIVSCPDRGSAILFLEGDARYNLLLFELELRGATGLELAQLARSLSHREHLPIVIVTANEVIGELEALARNSCADEFVTKKDLAAVPEAITYLLGLGTNELVARD